MLIGNLLIQESIQQKAFGSAWVELMEMNVQLQLVGDCIAALNYRNTTGPSDHPTDVASLTLLKKSALEELLKDKRS